MEKVGTVASVSLWQSSNNSFFLHRSFHIYCPVIAHILPVIVIAIISVVFTHRNPHNFLLLEGLYSCSEDKWSAHLAMTSQNPTNCLLSWYLKPKSSAFNNRWNYKFFYLLLESFNPTSFCAKVSEKRIWKEICSMVM